MSERKRYTVELTSAAEKTLERLPKKVVIRLDKAINSLANDPRPRGYKKLVGTDNDYRIRVGDYRIIYLFNVGLYHARERGAGHLATVRPSKGLNPRQEIKSDTLPFGPPIKSVQRSLYPHL
jgi:mRNA interferase RelE/StbE